MTENWKNTAGSMHVQYLPCYGTLRNADKEPKVMKDKNAEKVLINGRNMAQKNERVSSTKVGKSTLLRGGSVRGMRYGLTKRQLLALKKTS